MSKKYISTDKAPTPGSYSQAVCVDSEYYRFVFLAGQTGNLPGVAGEPVIEGGVGPQTTQTLKNILAIVVAAGGHSHDIVELKVFLKDSVMDDHFKPAQREKARLAFNDAYVKFFAEHERSSEEKNLPARTLVWVAEVPLEYPNEDTLVEITAIATIPKHPKAW
jgi:enamine deaminase RidA (YjgF/YER057c/UK114 family)